MLVWMDLEMTGLDPSKHLICEIATIITDDELEVIDTGPSIVIHVSDPDLKLMDDWCVQHHGDSGLTHKMKTSTTTARQAEVKTLNFIKRHIKAHGAPLCGNSIWQDRRFLAAQMPELEQYLHYRCVDVSSIKELAKRWYPKKRAPGKGSAHRALDDIKDSIAELKYYRKHLFIDQD